MSGQARQAAKRVAMSMQRIYSRAARVFRLMQHPLTFCKRRFMRTFIVEWRTHFLPVRVAANGNGNAI